MSRIIFVVAAVIWAVSSQITVAGQEPAQADDVIQTVTYSGHQYYKYTVKAQETIYSLCKRFNVKEDELIANNPFLRHGLKAGQMLLIPVNTNVVENITLPEDTLSSSPADSVLSDVTPVLPVFDKKRVTSFVLLLPLMLGDTSDVSNQRYVEFYEGMLLAADTLRRLGVSLDITVHDIGKTQYSMNKVLSRKSFNDVDYIIAAANNAQMPDLSKWVSVHHKHLILPFNSRIPETATNEWIYQINPPREMSYKQLLKVDTSVFRNKNILFLRTAKEEKDERQQLFSGWKSLLNRNGIPYRELTDAGLDAEEGEDYQDILDTVMSPERVNLIIPAPVSLTEANRIISLVGASANAVQAAEVELWGYPEWIALNKSNLPQLHKMNAQIFGNYYVNFTSSKARDFTIKYSLLFGKDMMNTFPKYAMMAYDIAIYFIGKNLDCNFNIAPLQHDMNFQQFSKSGGWYNTTVYKIQYHPDRTITADIIAR